MRLKKILKLGVVSSATLPLMYLVSAGEEQPSTGTSTNNDPNNPASSNENTNPAPAPEPANFAELKPKHDKLVNDRLVQFIEKAIENVKKTITEEKIIADENNLEWAQLVKVMYYTKVLNYLNSKKDQIIANPNQNNFNIIFPKVLASENYKMADITYGEEVFAPTMVGLEAPYNYDKVTGLNEANKIEYKSDENVANKNSEETILKATNDYFDNLDSEWESILLNNGDIPKYSNHKEAFELNETTEALELKLPEGFTDWNDYISKKLDNQTLKYDLTKNMEFNEEETEPIIPEKPVIDEIVEDPKKIRAGEENIPRIAPILDSTSYNLSNQQLAALFNQGREAFNAYNVFFNNPLLTSIAYEIVELRTEGEQLIAKILIKEKTKVSDSSTATYEKPVVRLANAKESEMLKASIKAINETFSEFYKALNINLDTLDLADLASKELAQAVFNQIFDAIKMYYSESFTNLQNAILNDLQNQSEAEISKVSKDLFVSSLNNQTINSNYFFDYLSITYRKIFNSYKERIQDPTTKIAEATKANFELLKLDIEKLKKAFDAFPLLIVNLDRTTDFTNFYQKDYQHYLSKLKILQTQFFNIATLTQTKKIEEAKASNPNIENEYLKAYEELIINANDEQNKTNFIIIGTLLSILASIGVTGLLIKLISVLKKKKINRGKNDK
ncbi:MSC_0620 family F1-like ATPase-associated subunit [Mycoplasmopsis iners]|uniref:MSC_0620 family F1-like ATPase-associated subunit n=1 Tax=Mycoplasmopsis iners TaxID=76630 RepID=UPI0004976950|nr:hypothetical protein [Mycoplasmopsis iners]